MDQPTAQLLVVDDDENNRDMLSRRLERHGYKVTLANNGQQALAAVTKQRPDLIVLDIEMPVMNGFEALRKLRETHPATQLPVVIATAHGDREDVVQALKLGANDFVTKPLDFPVVLARVQTQLSLKFGVDRIVALEADLRKRNTELQEANGRMKHSLRLASKMQQSLLPDGPIDVPGVKFAWVYQPCDELAGDILNVFRLGSDHVGLYLLDVSGHGVPAALLSTTLCRMLAPVPGQASFVERKTPAGMSPRRPRTVAEELNRRFPMTGDHGQYFTLFYGVIDLKTRQMQYVCAGHPPALLVPATGEPKYIEGAGFAIGWMDDPGFEENVLDLQEGDRLYLYSDGLTETMNAADDQFGTDRLASACGKREGVVLQGSLDGLLEQTATFRGNEPVADDISALALEIVPT